MSKLLQKVEVTLKSKQCFAIRFQLENIRIQTYMYAYIVDAIRGGRIRLAVGTGDNYDDTTNPHTLTFGSDDPPARTIVHEATHAVIDATHKGQKMSRGANEAAAYLAEGIYGLYTSESMGQQFPGYFARTLFELAEKVHAFNLNHRSGLFVCPLEEAVYLKTVIATLPRSYGSANQIETMRGIGDGA